MNSMYADLHRPRQGSKQIICTQPRRIAAREVAKRVATELDVEVGQEVGYAFRHEDQTGETTRLVYATDGHLLRRMEGDHLLKACSCIIVDEAHERTESTDLLLGLLKILLPRRKDLKLIVISATMSTDTFRAYFKAPVFTIPGRTFPVETNYLFREDHLQASSHDYVYDAMRVVLYLNSKYMKGDVLIFVPDEDDIHMLLSALRCELTVEGWVLVPLYGGMSKAEQDAALAPDTKRQKVIVATNIAETSSTVDGIVHVVVSFLPPFLYDYTKMYVFT